MSIMTSRPWSSKAMMVRSCWLMGGSRWSVSVQYRSFRRRRRVPQRHGACAKAGPGGSGSSGPARAGWLEPAGHGVEEAVHVDQGLAGGVVGLALEVAGDDAGVHG